MKTEKKIGDWAEEFIDYKRSIGYVYGRQQYLLQNYVDFTHKRQMNLMYPTKQSVNEFLNTKISVPGTLYNATCVLREFSRYLLNHGFRDAYIIPPKSATQVKPEPPYFFTKEEIQSFFTALDSIKPHSSFKGRELVMPALFRVLYCCGLRNKEARTLLYSDVHPLEFYMDILQSKGPKSRRLFISHELSIYLQEYDANISLLFPRRKYFFPHKENVYVSSTVTENFKRFWLKAYPDSIFEIKPTAYDLRHNFACENLNRWAAEGCDINSMLAYLSRYMGHQSIRGTLYYFHFIPEYFSEFVDKSKALEEIIPEVQDEEE